MEERHYLTRCRIDTREVRPLPEIAPMTCKREVAQLIRAAMLLCNYVLHVMGQLTMFLPKQAVLATIARTAADRIAYRTRHE